MYKVLVPIDFSKTSKNALLYAAKLFEGTDVEITVLNIFGNQGNTFTMKNLDDIFLREAESEMKKFMKEIEAMAPSVRFESKLVNGYAVSTITEMGNSGTYDFIIMGTKGVSGLKEVFVGSVAGGVIKKTSAPVIVVPLDYQFRTLNNVVFAIGDKTLTEAETLPLKKLIKLHDSQLELLHLAEKEASNVDETIAAIKELKHIYTHKESHGDINHNLDVHIQNNDTDLLCLLRTNKGFFQRVFGGSVTLKQTFHSSVPLLILHT